MAITNRAYLPSDVCSTNVHVAKRVQRQADLELPGGWLKWYTIALPGTDPGEAAQSARDWLTVQVAAGSVPLTNQVGFVEVHHGTNVVYLIASTWRNENELWQTTWGSPSPGEPGWKPISPTDQGHRLVSCVWELMPVSFERDAWVRFLRSRRTAHDMESYRQATFEGMG